MQSFHKLAPRIGLKSAPGDAGEMQNMLPSIIKVHRLSNAQKPAPEDNGGVCLMTESPYRILRVGSIIDLKRESGKPTNKIPQ